MPGRRWRIAGSGQAGIIAAYAALFEPAISRSRGRESPDLASRRTDLPGRPAGAGHSDRAGDAGTPAAHARRDQKRCLERTKTLYERAGAGDHLKCDAN